jgi:RNA polymerase sigma-70 factor, ECF subfamily
VELFRPAGAPFLRKHVAQPSGGAGLSSLELAARRAATGDGQAFEAVCRALQDDVWRYCYALVGDPELAAEAAQETFLRSVRSIRRFRGEAPVRVWFLTLARRSSAEVMRRAARAPLLAEQRPADQPTPGPSMEAHLLVEGLPTELRQAFVLTQILGLSYAETGAVTGCPVGTVRSRVFRARARLIAAWTDDGNEHDTEGDADVDR